MPTGLLSEHAKQVLAKARQGKVTVPISTQVDGRSAESRAANPKLPPTQSEIMDALGIPKAAPVLTQEQIMDSLGIPKGVTQHTKDVLAQAKIPVTEAPKYNILETAKANLRKDLLRPYVTPEMVERLPSPLRPLGTAAREFTSPAQLAILGATAGLGPTLAAGIKGGTGALGMARGIVAGAVAPVVKGGFAARLGGEAALGIGATLAGQQAAARIPETAPMPVRLGVPLAAGLVGGVGALGAIRAAPALGRGAQATLGRAIETGGAAAGIPKAAETTAARVPKSVHPGLDVVKDPSGGWQVIHSSSKANLVGNYSSRDLAEDFATRASKAADFTQPIDVLRPQVEEITGRIRRGESLPQAKGVILEPGTVEVAQPRTIQTASRQPTVPKPSLPKAAKPVSQTAEAQITRADLLAEAKQFKSFEDFLKSIQTELGVYDKAGNPIPMNLQVEGLGEAKLSAIYAQPMGKRGGGWFYKAQDIWDEAHSVAPKAAEPIAATSVPAITASTEMPPSFMGKTWYRGHAEGQTLGRTETFISASQEQAAPFASQVGGKVSEITFNQEPRVFPNAIPWDEYQRTWRNSALLKNYDVVPVIEPNGQATSFAVRNRAVIESQAPVGAETPPTIRSGQSPTGVTAAAGQGLPPPGAAAPPIKPPVRPTATGGVPPSGAVPSGQGITDTLAQAKATVAQAKPGTISQVASRIPVVKQLYQRLVPSSHLPTPVLEGYVGEGLARGTVETQAQLIRQPGMDSLDTLFGKNATHTMDFKPQGVKFTGTAAERAANATGDYTGTLADILERPSLYDLSAEQRAAIEQFQAARSGHFQTTVPAYNVKIAEYPLQPGGMHLAHVGIGEDAIAAAGSHEAALTHGRASERFYPTMADRLRADAKFRPDTTVGNLLAADDSSVAKMAGRNVFLEGAGGKTKLQAMEELHPELAAKMKGLQGKLNSLKSAADRLGGKQGAAIDEFLASPLEDANLATLQADLNPTIGANAVDRQGVNFGKDLATLRAEVAAAKRDIVALRPAWRTANLNPYTRVQEAGNLLFPGDQAAQIRQLMEKSNSPFLRMLDNIRATAFGGDFSPVTIQMFTEWLSDPIGASRFIAEGKAGFTQEFMLKAMQKDPEGWARFTKGTGLNPLGGMAEDLRVSGIGSEFSSGYFAKIPKLGKYWETFNDAVYRPVMQRTKAVFDSSYEGAIKLGLTEEQAIAVAAHDATSIIPRYNYRLLGQSQKVAAQSRAALTSVSFLTQPAALMNDATKGMLKLGTGQAISPTERFAVKRVLMIAATTEAIAVLSHANYARTHDQDVGQAIRDSLNPSSGYFMSAVLPNGARFGIGGPFRSITRAVWPRAIIPSLPGVPIPFAGLYGFAEGKVAPGVKFVETSLKNKDYYGKAIRTEAFPVNILQNLAYGVESVLPLTLGSTAQQTQLHTLSPEKIGKTDKGAIGQETASQFLGTNYQQRDAVYEAKLHWAKDLAAYDALPTKGDTYAETRIASRNRDAYRATHPDVEAKLFITGVVESFGDPPRTNAIAAAVKLMKENGIGVKDIKSLEVKPDESPNKTMLRQFFEQALSGASQVPATMSGNNSGFKSMNQGGERPKVLIAPTPSSGFKSMVSVEATP